MIFEKLIKEHEKQIDYMIHAILKMIKWNLWKFIITILIKNNFFFKL